MDFLTEKKPIPKGYLHTYDFIGNIIDITRLQISGCLGFMGEWVLYRQGGCFSIKGH